VWARAGAGPLRDLLDRGVRAAGEAALTLGARVVEEPDWRAAAPAADLIRNLNTPGDMTGIGH
jgi:hypothetical protein